jgi:hypothetical protein
LTADTHQLLRPRHNVKRVQCLQGHIVLDYHGGIVAFARPGAWCDTSQPLLEKIEDALV